MLPLNHFVLNPCTKLYMSQQYMSMVLWVPCTENHIGRFGIRIQHFLVSSSIGVSLVCYTAATGSTSRLLLFTHK